MDWWLHRVVRSLAPANLITLPLPVRHAYVYVWTTPPIPVFWHGYSTTRLAGWWGYQLTASIPLRDLGPGHEC
jgi:hypothetical protein